MSAAKKIDSAVENNKPTVNPEEIKRLGNEIEALYKGIMASEEKQPSIISEADFVTGFLPYFCGEADIKQNPDFVKTWIGIAGSPSSEVAVVDGNFNELYRVPALLNTKNIEPKTDGSYHHLLEEYQNQGAQIPALGETFLMDESKNLLKEVDKEIEANKEEEDRWNEIFKRYGKSTPSTLKDNKEIILDDDDMLSYD